MAQVYFPVNPNQRVQLPDIWETVSASGIHLDIADLSTLEAPSTKKESESRHNQNPQDYRYQYINQTNPQVVAVNTQENPPNYQMMMQQSFIKKKRKERKRTVFTDTQRKILLDWLQSHKSNPYPTINEKNQLMMQTGLNRNQLNNWFTNNRIRLGMTSSHANKVPYGAIGVSKFNAF